MAKLVVVPTPIGNLDDMTFRGIKALKEADLILAEDTRTTSVLLKHFDIQKPMRSHHKFNEHQTVEEIAERVLGGENIALVSDAGTPAISDPGFLLVRECVRRGVDVECLQARGRRGMFARRYRFCSGAGRLGIAKRPFLLRGFPAPEERAANTIERTFGGKPDHDNL